MDRMRRVAQVWNWLPAFRAVAETEHLPTAAAGLHVTPPALSRTLTVLQEDVGVPLFDRVGRGLELNPQGRRLLLAVRSAMRIVHDALADVEDGHEGPLSIASLGMFTSAFLEPTLLALVDAHPDVLPRVCTTTPDDPASELLQGHLDVVFTSTPFYREGLTTRALGRVENGIFCGPGHALHGVVDVDADRVLAHPFVAPPADALGRTPEGWPPEHRRNPVRHRPVPGGAARAADAPGPGVVARPDRPADHHAAGGGDARAPGSARDGRGRRGGRRCGRRRGVVRLR